MASMDVVERSAYSNDVMKLRRHCWRSSNLIFANHADSATNRFQVNLQRGTDSICKSQVGGQQLLAVFAIHGEYRVPPTSRDRKSRKIDDRP